MFKRFKQFDQLFSKKGVLSSDFFIIENNGEGRNKGQCRISVARIIERGGGKSHIMCNNVITNFQKEFLCDKNTVE